MVKRLGLGSAQFGLDYGITNATGKVAAAEVGRILACAEQEGIDLIDTAHLYGDSECSIGAVLRPQQRIQIVTKTPKFAGLSDSSAAVERLRDAFAVSLSRLNRTAVYGLLLHDANDLLGPCGAALWSAMEHLRQVGRVERIGVSVYTAPQIEALLARYPVQLMQLPLNAVDARLKRSGTLERLAQRGIELHARSVFLQGLLLAAPETMGPHFRVLKDAVSRMARDCAAEGLTQLDGALAAVLAHAEIARVIIGVTSREELEAVVRAAARAPRVFATLRWQSWEIADDDVLNPATWPTTWPVGAEAQR
jgi:aryl-alcohol dehydrogenase-like predicted oxidoreductase